MVSTLYYCHKLIYNCSYYHLTILHETCRNYGNISINQKWWNKSLSSRIRLTSKKIVSEESSSEKFGHIVEQIANLGHYNENKEDLDNQKSTVIF